MTTTAQATAARTAAEWVEGFADGWRAPTDAESFCDHFDSLIADDIRLVQPQLPEISGKRAFREEFARPLFDLLHEVRGIVGSWASRAEGDAEIVFIELTIRARLAGGRRVALRTTDKITLRNGVAVERIASVDPLDLLGGVLLSPRSWPAFVRARLGR
jgi:ketosteroid isomerase-like protein